MRLSKKLVNPFLVPESPCFELSAKWLVALQSFHNEFRLRPSRPSAWKLKESKLEKMVRSKTPSRTEKKQASQTAALHRAPGRIEPCSPSYAGYECPVRRSRSITK